MKFIGILIVAAVVPVCMALLVFETLGYKSYRDALGRLQETRAKHLALTVSDLVRQELESLDDFMTLTDLAGGVRDATKDQPELTPEEFRKQIDEIEARWPSLGVEDPLINRPLTNEIAGQLNAFRSLHRMFAEIFVTDAQGRLLAATRKTTDFWQADEEWWQRGFSLSPRTYYVAGINFDESAGVHSLDVAVPIRDRKNPQSAPVGVLKGVINASPFFSMMESVAGGDSPLRQVVLEDGRILASLYAPAVEPLKEHVSEAALKHLRAHQAGWFMEHLTGEDRELIGYAPLRISGTSPVGLEVVGTTPMYVLVRQPADAVLAPARRQIMWLGVAGTFSLFAFIVVGYVIATRKLIEPIESLREAVHRIAAAVKLDPEPSSTFKSSDVLVPLHRIKTHDELEGLAFDFERMAQRVLGYSEHLEREIAAKTAEISRDLQLAREFQEALMPHSFPKVPSDAHLSPLSLGFHHLYKPALSVGGDFFDVLKLDDQRAGVFIADVMGHGARSALVTAILRTLLQNLSAESADPARFLSMLNRHFHSIMKNSGETIFVSAFYLVVDTQDATVRYASAGHPSPFIAHRSTGEVRELVPHLQGNPALGLFPSATYQQWTLAVQAGDVFVLFTDGVHEAYNDAGEEFGLERVRTVISEYLRRPDADIPAAIVSELERFIAPAVPADDICIVALEVNAAAAPDAKSSTPASESAH